MRNVNQREQIYWHSRFVDMHFPNIRLLLLRLLVLHHLLFDGFHSCLYRHYRFHIVEQSIFWCVFPTQVLVFPTDFQWNTCRLPLRRCTGVFALHPFGQVAVALKAAVVQIQLAVALGATFQCAKC